MRLRDLRKVRKDTGKLLYHLYIDISKQSFSKLGTFDISKERLLIHNLMVLPKLAE